MESNETRKQADNELYKRLIVRIYQEERANFKTQKYKKNEMTERIRKIIELEVGRDAD
jgi:hypothetical protein